MATLDEIRLQQLLSPFTNTGITSINQKYMDPKYTYDGLYQDTDRFLDFDNSIFDKRLLSTIETDYPFTGNIPTNRLARNDARAYNRNEPLPSPYGMQSGTFFKDFSPRIGLPSQIPQNLEFLNNKVSQINNQTTGTADTAPFFFPQINNQVPQINNQVPLNFDTSYGVANTPNVIGEQSGLNVYESDDGRAYYIDPDTGQEILAPGTVEAYKKQSGYYGKEPSGIAKLFEFLKKLPTPFNLARRGLESLRGANQRLRNTDFGQSRTGAEYFMKRRERKQGERARAANADVYASADRQGFTNDRGGFSTNRADRAGTSVGSGQFNSKTSRGRTGY